MLIFYFLAGIVGDFLVSLNYRLLNSGHKGYASVCTVITVFILLSVIKTISSDIDAVNEIACYALGSGVGTYLSMMVNIEGG
jgi:uncharacterized protein YebE (UPF0316 family)